jgi:hypothetical protein
MRLNRRSAIGLSLGLGGGATLGLAWGGAAVWDELIEKRVAVVAPGRLLRGAWQRPWPLRRIIARAQVRTIVTLTAINRDDPKDVRQARVVRDSGVSWVLVPMRGSRATLEQMAEAADLLADPGRQPVFFHCVAGHHRTSLAHAAYLIRHRDFSADDAWREVAALPWTRPDAAADRGDRALIEAFAAAQRQDERSEHASRTDSNATVGVPGVPGHGAGRGRVCGVEPGDRQLRDRADRPDLPFGPDARG